MLGGLAGLVGLSVVAAVLVTATVTPAIAVSGTAATSAISMFDNLPKVLDIEKLMLPSTVYAKVDPGSDQYQPIAKFYDQNRSPVAFDEIAPVVYDSILSSEDKNFYKHGGIDLIGTLSAVVDNVRGRDSRGGSSISQQYVKNVLVQKCEATAETQEALDSCYTQATQSKGSEGIQRKLQEMRYAIALEDKYSKNDILLGYLNIAGFGGTTYGVDAAARYYFNVPAAQLSLSQAATLAGMVQNPNTYRIDKPGGSTTDKAGNPLNSAEDGYKLTKDRRDYVLTRLLADGKITKEQHDAALAEPITPAITPATTGCAAAAQFNAAFFCQYVKNIIKTDTAFGETPEDRMKTLQRGGLDIYTTLDYRIQNTAQDTIAQNAPAALPNLEFGAASVSVEVGTGRILSMVQNKNFSEDANLTANDHSYTSLVYGGDYAYGGSIGFAAGSTFKLFTLVDWLEQGHSLNENLNGKWRVIKRVKNSCEGDWVNTRNEKPSNFGMGGGRVGTPMQFTAASLNSGYFAMAEKLDLCDIGKVAAKMGVKNGDGSPIKMPNLFDIIGSANVAPIDMAGAYATIASNGVYCQPKAIDRVTDADGNDLTPPQTSCSQVLDPKIAATAAYALQGVMNGGTGAVSNPRDGTPLIGKTGTNEDTQTWMVESSTKVATAVWVGNTTGEGSLSRNRSGGVALNQLRHRIAPPIQHAANEAYGGDKFPAPDQDLLKTVMTDLPSVVGLPVDQAKQTLEDAGFDVVVGDPVDSGEAEGIVAAQDPGAGKVAGGTTVTINPSNGQGLAIPDVTGRNLMDAIGALRGAGFGNVQPGTCTEDDTATGQGKVTSTSPPAGTVTNRNAAISVNYSREHCS
ncbi:transglycosylase domain-containing protein [Microbacterium ulmi]